jgi:hypothetical protein
LEHTSFRPDTLKPQDFEHGAKVTTEAEPSQVVEAVKKRCSERPPIIVRERCIEEINGVVHGGPVHGACTIPLHSSRYGEDSEELPVCIQYMQARQQIAHCSIRRGLHSDVATVSDILTEAQSKKAEKYARRAGRNGHAMAGTTTASTPPAATG